MGSKTLAKGPIKSLPRGVGKYVGKNVKSVVGLEKGSRIKEV
jgi:hypothetical protein